MLSTDRPVHRKTVTRRFIERTIKGKPLGFEAYLWAAQRITGLVILAFLILHLYTLSSIFGGEAAYNQALQSMDKPMVKIGELLLLWVVLFHGLNGVRLVLLNVFSGFAHKSIAYLVPVFSLLLILFSIPLYF